MQSSQPLRPGHPLWITCPFDPENGGAQPESVARVVRCVKPDGVKSISWNLAVQFAGLPVRPDRAGTSVLAGRECIASQNGNGHGSDVALPIRVRPITVPWHEEAMTIEVSPNRLKFQTNREYQFGERLMVAFVAAGDNPWVGEGECETEVVGIEASAGSDRLQITVRRKAG